MRRLILPAAVRLPRKDMAAADAVKGSEVELVLAVAISVLRPSPLGKSAMEIAVLVSAKVMSSSCPAQPSTVP